MPLVSLSASHSRLASQLASKLLVELLVVTGDITATTRASLAFRPGRGTKSFDILGET